MSMYYLYYYKKINKVIFSLFKKQKKCLKYWWAIAWRAQYSNQTSEDLNSSPGLATDWQFNPKQVPQSFCASVSSSNE